MPILKRNKHFSGCSSKSAINPLVCRSLLEFSTGEACVLKKEKITQIRQTMRQTNFITKQQMKASKK